MDSYARYEQARNASWQILIDYKICALPVDVVDITNKAGISIVKNSDVHELSDNESGAGILHGKDWYIVYDDTSCNG